MTKEDKIKELELEVARLKGVIEGMKTNPYRLYPSYPAHPYTPPFWYQTYCGGGGGGGVSTSPATVPYNNGTSSTTANFGPTTISGMN